MEISAVALLQWAYAREKVHLARPPGLDAGARMVPRGFAVAASSERIGAAVGSSMNLGFAAPRDAYAVAAAVQQRGRDAALLREYAMIGHAPDWTPQPAIFWERGAPIYGRDGHGRVGRRIIGYCVFAHGDLDAIVGARRAVYRRWALAVAAVRAVLIGDKALTDHALTDELPLLEPWVC